MKTKNKRAKIKKRAWVKIDFGNLHPEQRPHYEQYKGKRFIYFGDIPNQPGHCLILDLGKSDDTKSQRFIILHTDELVAIAEDD